jgi:hypothetical protein
LGSQPVSRASAENRRRTRQRAYRRWALDNGLRLSATKAALLLLLLAVLVGAWIMLRRHV